MQNTKDILNHIAESIRQTRNDPHDQLLGYLTSGDVAYITRRNNACELIRTVDMVAISQYVKNLEK